MATFFYYGLCVEDLVKPDKAYMDERKQEREKDKDQKRKERKEKEEEEVEEGEAMYFNFGVHDQEDEMLRQAIAMSLA